MKLKTICKTIVSKVKEIDDKKLRVAFVVYRDHSNGPNRIQYINFTENIDELKTFVNRVEAMGGEDIPEGVLGGLEAVTRLSWASSSKFIFHIGDAPQHRE